jgi:hypothetical protein
MIRIDCKFQHQIWPPGSYAATKIIYLLSIGKSAHETNNLNFNQLFYHSSQSITFGQNICIVFINQFKNKAQTSVTECHVKEDPMGTERVFEGYTIGEVDF